MISRRMERGGGENYSRYSMVSDCRSASDLSQKGTPKLSLSNSATAVARRSSSAAEMHDVRFVSVGKN